MESIPLTPTSFFDHLFWQAQSRRKPPSKCRRSKAGPGRRPPDNTTAAPWPAPLVEEDRIYFSILMQPARLGAPLVPADRSEPRVRLAEGAFRRAFTATWARVPRGGREALLRYWRCPSSWLDGEPATPATLANRPEVLLVETAPWAEELQICSHFGCRLTFPLALAVDGSDRLPESVAVALAQAALHASGRHWSLIQEMIEGPIAKWERRRGKRATDEARDARLDRLEEAHARAYHQAVEEIVRGWGLGPAAPREGQDRQDGGR